MNDHNDQFTVFEFWQKRADLSVLSPADNLRILLACAGLVVGLLLLALLFPEWRDAVVEEVAIQLCLGVGLVALGGWTLVAEMFHKGGKAALDIKREGDSKLIQEQSRWKVRDDEFTEYRITREDELKRVERERGGTIAKLQSRVAELEELVTPKLTVNYGYLQFTDRPKRWIDIAVHNDAMFAATKVSVVVEEFEAVGLSPEEKAKVNVVALDIRGRRLIPRHAWRMMDDLSIAGDATMEFEFLEFMPAYVSLKTDRFIRYEPHLQILPVGRKLPDGKYRVVLIVSAAGQPSVRREYQFAHTPDGDMFDDPSSKPKSGD